MQPFTELWMEKWACWFVDESVFGVPEGSALLEMRPFYHKTDERIRAHVFLCMLAYYLPVVAEFCSAMILTIPVPREVWANNLETLIGSGGLLFYRRICRHRQLLVPPRQYFQ